MSTPEEVREHNEKVLRNIDRNALVEKFMLSIGCNEAQASTTAKAFAEKFTYDGAVLSFQGKPVIDARDDVVAHFASNKLDFLLPPKGANAGKPDVDADTLASARAGNITAKGRLVRQLGSLAAADAAIADKSDATVVAAADAAADKTKEDASKNPWRSENFRTDIAAQKRAAGIIKALGTSVAASMAKSAGKTLTGTPLKVA